MADQNNIIELTQEEFDHGELSFPANMVIVEMTHSNDLKVSKGGIIVGVLERVIHADNTDSNLKADLEEVYGTVVRVPDSLYFNEEDNSSMEYVTEMELQVGDQCWMSIMEAHSSLTLRTPEHTYKVIPYADIYVAKREIFVDEKDNWVGKKTHKVVVLNGNCLCQTTNKTKISELDVVSEGQIDTTRAIVKYIGKPITHYKNPTYVDHPDLKENDVVLLSPRVPFLMLERKKYFANFDGDNLYVVIPRRKISAVLKREER